MATARLSAPEKLSLDGDTEQSWRFFKQKFNLYILAAGLNDKADEVRVALLLTLGGDELLRIYNTLDFGPPTTNADTGVVTDPSKILDTVIIKFDAYFAPRKLVIASRYRFRSCKQDAGESLDSYMTRLKTLVKDCDYGAERDDALRDQLVFGCLEDRLREKFLREETLSLNDALSICQSHESSRKQMSIIRNEHDETTSINRVQKTNRPRPNRVRSDDKEERNKERPTTVNMCRYCGNNHIWDIRKCPAYGKTCNYCKKKNHFRSQCIQVKKGCRKVVKV